MPNKIIEYFITLTQIPHCSQSADKLLEFLKEFATIRGYSVEIDKAQNILVKKGQPKLLLQAHYDMVCIGTVPQIQTYIKDGWMYAKNSSLGADNGIAIAMMMILMDRGEELEFLFTSDEEIGLIGASNLEFELNSKYMLNIDFEDEAEVCIGCAGGADLLAFRELDSVEPLNYTYQVSISGLAGGHSGVDIDKKIPNAIKVLAKYLSDKEIVISSFEGGERRNSIPTHAEAIVSSKKPLLENKLIKVSSIDTNHRFYNSQDFINLLNDFKHGVDSYNKELNIPNSSINLAMVKFDNGKVSIETSVRAMSAEGIDKISHKNISLFQKYSFDAKMQYKYPSWQPQINDFSKIVSSSMFKVFGQSKYRAIHAGLECGIFSKKYPNILLASIGPNIRYPHSKREKIEIESIFQTFRVIVDIVNNIN